MEPMNGTRLSYADLFFIFLKAVCTFGGGLGILAVLEHELVRERKLVTTEEFLANYALGRIVPSGTMTALGVAYGYKFGGIIGTVVALAALTLPAFISTVLLTMGYHYLRSSPMFAFVPVTVLPAAVAFIAAAAVQLGRGLLRPSLDLLLAFAAFAGYIAFGLSPALLLLLGGGIGAMIFQREEQPRR
jgi:chromate transporter